MKVIIANREPLEVTDLASPPDINPLAVVTQVEYDNGTVVTLDEPQTWADLYALHAAGQRIMQAIDALKQAFSLRLTPYDYVRLDAALDRMYDVLNDIDARDVLLEVK